MRKLLSLGLFLLMGCLCAAQMSSNDWISVVSNVTNGAPVWLGARVGTNGFLVVLSDGGRIVSLSISNDGTAVGLGATNAFEFRGSNSAALPPEFNMGTNKQWYFRSFPQVAGVVMGNLSTSNSLKVDDITGATAMTNAALFTNSTAPVTLSNANSKIWTLVFGIKSNTPPAVATLNNGDVQWWSSNGSALYLIKKNQAGNLFTNLIGSAQ